MNDDMSKAEVMQAVKAFLIPSSLFVATIISAAGIFLLTSGYSLGFAFIAVSATIFVSTFIAIIRFQNKFRSEGKFRPEPDNGPEEALEFKQTSIK
jgi:hypothetical protein